LSTVPYEAAWSIQLLETTAHIGGSSTYGHLAVVNRLLEDKRVDPAAHDNNAIRIASQNGHLSVVNRLLEDKRVDPAADDNGAIRGASCNGHLSVVNRLLEDKRVDPAAHDNRAIRLASDHGHLSVVNRLLEDKRVNPAADDNGAILIASYKGHYEIVKRLLQNKRVNQKRMTTVQSDLRYIGAAELLLKDQRVDPAAIHRLIYIKTGPIAIPDAPDTDMLHLLSHTLSLPFPASSCIIRWQPLIRRHRYQQLLRLETLIASKWHKEGEHRDVSEDVIAKYVLGVTMQEYRVLDSEYDEAKIWLKCCDTAGCGKSGKMQVCSGCKQRHYCSRACQAKDWPQHKKVCQKKK
jgi:hypothetical protein